MALCVQVNRSGFDHASDKVAVKKCLEVLELICNLLGPLTLSIRLSSCPGLLYSISDGQKSSKFAQS